MTSQEIIEAIKLIIRMQAQNENGITLPFFDEKKNTILGILKLMQPTVSELDTISLNGFYETAVKEHKSVYPVDIDPSSALTKPGFQSWLTAERKETLSDDYINRYMSYLRNENRSEQVLAELARSSESILGKLSDPISPNAIYTCGLVVGNVQSGKTGNFNAVINRAVDAGYNLIIILSGIMEDLRSQTQLRLETDVIGEGVVNIQTEQQGFKGVGKVRRFGIQGNSEVQQVFSITSFKSDFKKQVQDSSFSLNNKSILVCKKNTGILKNLLIWLSDYLEENTTQHDIPLLIIDDEADNASLNNLGHKGREYASTINGHIRAILGLFTRKSYLGYTATPFANVLQDRNEVATGPWIIQYNRNGTPVSKSFKQVPNLFPDNFIELLSPPSNYIGAKNIFQTITETIKIPLVEPINDSRASFPTKIVDDPNGIRPATSSEIEEEIPNLRSSRRDDLFPEYLPESLKDAIECFVISIAVRLKRKPAMAGSKSYMPHNTMLIHISRFTAWQNRTKDLVELEVNSIIQRITTDLPSSGDSIYAKLEKTWNRYYASIVESIRTYLPEGYADEFLESVTFDEIKSLLPEAVKSLEVKAINNVTKEKLIYSIDSNGNGKKYIAIGGNRLSRGFTLEGLTINYFIRDTNYADTLLQMGRWFGYRPGYIDCCKLFTTWDAIEKFNATTLTIEELENEFRRMQREDKSPNEFVLRVKNHPGVLKITRPSILKNTIDVKWSYQDTLVQTIKYHINGNQIKDAWTGLKNLFATFNWTDRNDKYFYTTDTDINGLFRFLENPNCFSEYEAEFQQIKKFIELCQTKNFLTRWKIAIKYSGASKEKISAMESGLPGPIDLTIRSTPMNADNQFYKQLAEKKTFIGSGKSANIISAGLDMSLWLDDEQIKIADDHFIKSKTEEFIKDKKMSPADAEKKAKSTTRPERIYRERMGSDTGLLVIYLMDMRYVLREDDEKLNAILQEEKIDIKVPLIGFAIGFPPISPDPGGHYVRGNYNIEEDEPESEEFDEEILNAKEDSI